MLKTKIKLLALILVSLSGLISCESDKPEVIYVNDEGPAGSSLKGKSGGHNNLLESFQKLDINENIVFPKLTSQNFKERPMTITINSNCMIDGTVNYFAVDTKWKNESQINLVDILPTNHLLSLNNDDFICDFTFIFTNSNNSAHTELKKNIRITGRETLSQIDLPIDESGVIHYEQSKEVTLLSNNTVGAQTMLNCDDFNTSLEQPQIQLQDLIHPDDESAKFKSYRRQCRLLTKNNKHIRISSLFYIEFPFLAIQAVLEPRLIEKGFKQINELNVATLKIKNPNNFPINIHPQETASIFHFRPILFSFQNFRNHSFLGAHTKRTMQWHWPQGQSRKGYLVEAKQKIDVIGSVELDLKCESVSVLSDLNRYKKLLQAAKFQSFAYRPSYGFTGYNFDYGLPPINVSAGGDNIIPTSIPINHPIHESPTGLKLWRVFPQPTTYLPEYARIYFNGEMNIPHHTHYNHPGAASAVTAACHDLE